ncbi:extracellular solute-binding protein [Bacillus sp. SD088]|uniref:extracellular solute-binding protein n=1 Tax=Bacillus sp. SD088 TaxID=2782012 RepID=UPI001A974B94|nr:extracellular solute-binding protein [Bacillus sp. SD088]MBO0993542.1 extracellular solute-binding protein [Bacillus sp. SD088]
MRKIAYLGVILLIVLGACSSGEEDDNKLVIYSPNSEDIINTIIPMFEQETGIEVELVSAGAGELIKRVETESENPYGDILFGTIRKGEHPDLIQEYVSPNDEAMLEQHKNYENLYTPYITNGSVLLVNTDLIGDIKVDGYEDLLNPELKGKIAAADPAASSSSFAQLTNMLLAMGGDYTSDEGWDYVSQLVENLDGRVASGSGAVHRSVADGEYVVGLTYEDPALAYVRDGAPVEVVYPKEGTVFLDATVNIIKDAKNLDNAKEFVDFVISEQSQEAFGTELTNRPLRENVELGESMVDIADIYTIEEDEEYVREHKDEIVETYKDVFMEAQE